MHCTYGGSSAEDKFAMWAEINIKHKGEVDLEDVWMYNTINVFEWGWILYDPSTGSTKSTGVLKEEISNRKHFYIFTSEVTYENTSSPSRRCYTGQVDIVHHGDYEYLIVYY